MGIESACNEGDAGRREFDPVVRKNPLQYSCLENPMNRESGRLLCPGVGLNPT